MLGKVLLTILCVILGLLLVVLLIPAYLHVNYQGGELRVALKYAKLTIPLYPGKKDETVPDKPEETPADEPESKPKKEKQKINRNQILYSIDTLPTVLTKALKRTGKRLRIEPLVIHLLIATGDPADTAILYGKIEAALAAFLPVLHKTVRIREQDIRLFPDFCEERMDCIADVGIGLRPWDVLEIGICALGGIVKWYIGFRKRATKGPKTPNKTVDTTAQAETAA